MIPPHGPFLNKRGFLCPWILHTDKSLLLTIFTLYLERNKDLPRETLRRQ